MILQLNNKYIDFNETLAKSGFFVFCISAMFADIMSNLFGSNIMYVLYVFSVLIILVSVTKNNQIIFNCKSFKMLSGWLIFIVMFLLLHNQQIAHRSFFTTIRWLCYFSMILVLPLCPKNWYHEFLKILGRLTLINVFFLFFFLIFPDKYHVMFNIWGFWPTGTDSGRAGYRAGIASHYSENAMIMAVGMIVFSSFFMAYRERIKNKNCIKYAILAFSAMTGILFTAKRAHLLFGIMAILFGYFIYKPEMRKKNFFKVILIAGFIFILFSILSSMIPAVNYIYERFTTAGEDQESQTRFDMWKLAFENFSEHPVFGIGWGGFKYEFHEHLFNPFSRSERYGFLNAHNVYIQMLCECGITGTLIFWGNAIFLFINTIKLLNIKYIKYTTGYEIIIFSIIMQTFFYLYCFTGNCVYDMMFSFHAIAIGFSIGLNTEKRYFNMRRDDFEENRYNNVS